QRRSEPRSASPCELGHRYQPQQSVRCLHALTRVETSRVNSEDARYHGYLESWRTLDVPDIATGLKRLLRWRSAQDGQGGRAGAGWDEPPLRAKLSSTDWLQRHAKSLAGQSRIGHRCSADKLLPRLNVNAQVLDGAYDLVTRAVAR